MRCGASISQSAARARLTAAESALDTSVAAVGLATQRSAQNRGGAYRHTRHMTANSLAGKQQ